jgi:hypothetical protein
MVRRDKVSRQIPNSLIRDLPQPLFGIAQGAELLTVTS